MVMSEEEIKNDNKLKKMLHEGLQPMPFADFEEKVMARLETDLQVQASVKSSIVKSWLFLIIGFLLGLSLPSMLRWIPFPEMVHIEMLVWSVEILFVLAFLFFAERLVKMTIKQGKE
jgi:hypothetical protein